MDSSKSLVVVLIVVVAVLLGVIITKNGNRRDESGVHINVPGVSVEWQTNNDGWKENRSMWDAFLDNTFRTERSASTGYYDRESTWRYYPRFHYAPQPHSPP